MSQDKINQYLLARQTGIKGHKCIYNRIKQALETGEPLFIGKIGANELNICYQSMLINNKQIADYNGFIKNEAFVGVGIYPQNSIAIQLFNQEYLKALRNIDILASWNDNALMIEQQIWEQVININPSSSGIVDAARKELVDLTSLESFYVDKSLWWQDLLHNKTVLIISPFTKSIQHQLELDQRMKVWPDSGKWNGFWDMSINFKYVTFPHPFALVSEEQQRQYPKTWLHLLDNIYKEIDNIGEFDIALIGAGGYSILLGSYIKNKKGRIAFHLGGGLQMMLGVYGNRWYQDGNGSGFFKEYINDAWVRPSEDEIPEKYKKQENGCYF
jgi:hypothetical protein